MKVKITYSEHDDYDWDRATWQVGDNAGSVICVADCPEDNTVRRLGLVEWCAELAEALGAEVEIDWGNHR